MHVCIKIIAQHQHHTHELCSSATGGLSPTIPPSWSVPDCPALSVAASALSLVMSFRCSSSQRALVKPNHGSKSAFTHLILILTTELRGKHHCPHTKEEESIQRDSSTLMKYVVQAPQKVSKKWQIKVESYLTPNLIFSHQGLSHLRSFIYSLNKYLLGATMWAPG